MDFHKFAIAGELIVITSPTEPKTTLQNRKQLYRPIGMVVQTAEIYMDFTSHWG